MSGDAARTGGAAASTGSSRDADALSADAMREWARLGTATVYEASGRQGLVDVELTQLVPGSRVAGPALPVSCGQGDNLMVHAAIEHISPGDVVVLTMPEPAPVALVGELLVTQMKLRGAAGLLVDASVRDCDDLAALGLPVWTRWVRVRGAGKGVVGTVGEPVTVGGASVRRGDVVVLDRDGAVVVARERADEVMRAARARVEKEAAMRERFAAGEISYDIRQLVEGRSAEAEPPLGLTAGARSARRRFRPGREAATTRARRLGSAAAPAGTRLESCRMVPPVGVTMTAGDGYSTGRLTTEMWPGRTSRTRVPRSTTAPWRPSTVSPATAPPMWTP